ncbi:hypothetical protein F4820DRAFT_187752 [Hypoxylon rubiginosum]|uniref:Uncharacterized protein n=1 Tax=Hypoxylon rubiginosum TaxID=110542 RepID=A0ACB9Z7V8_9PEZI|nr:hypothetical protein F4820DRAFT_187752 [Hypoxylon rubiginosum]
MYLAHGLGSWGVTVAWVGCLGRFIYRLMYEVYAICYNNANKSTTSTRPADERFRVGTRVTGVTGLSIYLYIYIYIRLLSVSVPVYMYV